MIGFIRRRWTFGETLALLWAVPLVALLGLFVASLRSDEPVWVVPLLVLFAGVPSYVAFAFRFEDRRLRRALERALHEDAFVEDYDEEGRHIGILKPDGIVWTVDGTPSDLRTRWTP